MNWFANLRTATKLTLAFSMACIITAFVGFTGVQRMGQINGMLNTLYERDLVGLSLINEANTDLAIIGRTVRQAVLDTGMADMERSRADIQRRSATMDSMLTAFEKTVALEETKAKLAEARRTKAEYVDGANRVVELTIARRDAEAKARLNDIRPLGTKLDALLTDVATGKKNLGRKAYEESDVVYARARLTMIWSIVLGVLVSLGLGIVIARMISRPLGDAVRVLESTAGGDLTTSLDVATKDEIGQLAQSLNAAVTSMRTTLTEVRSSADATASAAQQLQSASEEISSGAQEQASSLEETAASLEQMTATIKQNADNAQQASQLAGGAREVAEKGGQVVSEAVVAMRAINQSSTQIAEIITTIDEIAFQTNLLALNAAVEAARAGQQGRGFAVVAGEVRKLAQRSATAAKEIKGLIQDSVRKVENGTTLVNDSGKTLGEIVTAVKRVTDIVNEIAAASREQATGIDQVNRAVTQMDQVTQQNASQTEELSSTAEALAAQAEQLQSNVAQFVLEQQGTKAVRAAAKPAAPAPVRSKAPVKRAGFAVPPKVLARAGVAAGGNGNGHPDRALPGLDEEFEEY
ncbi:MAG TPA: methyl-accepting chemotaxis protein [Gemmatimonadaceae bacterium]|nr:methyl-accepting chemotaxis protein [Gemmatimonadaceae bacterium]